MSWLRRVVAVVGMVGLVGAACTPPQTEPGSSNSGLSTWKELRPAAVAMSDGRLAVFKVNKSGRLEWRVQSAAMTAANNYRFVDWIAAQTFTAGPALVGSPSAVLNSDNTLSVVARGADGVMYALRQTLVDPAAPSSSFGTWVPMPVLGSGLSFAASPTAGEFTNDALRDVVVLGSDGNLWTTSQLDSTSWAAWTLRYGAGEGLAGSVGAARRADNGRTENWLIASNGELKVTDSAWSGTFTNYGGAWKNSPAAFLAGTANRLSVVGTNAAKELLVQQFLPTTATSTVALGVQGSPAAARSGSTSYVFAIRADGRVQFAATNDSGLPGTWYVIDQPPAPQPTSPADGAVVYAPGEVTLVANPVIGADEYRFQLFELGGGGRTLVQSKTTSSSSWTLPPATLTAGKNYQWEVRAWNSTTKLLSDTRTFGMVASNQTSAPIRQSPPGDGMVDPYGPVLLTAGAVQGADAYKFTVYKGPGFSNQVFTTTVGVTAQPGQPVTAVIPTGVLAVGSPYLWKVESMHGNSTPSGTCCGTFLATTGAVASAMIARTNSGQGYWQIDYAGGVAAFGDAIYSGRADLPPGAGWTAVGIVARPRSNDDYWILADSGAIYSFGGAPYLGGANGMFPPGSGWRAVGMAPTPTGNGYWILADSGAVYTFGDAGYFGGANGLFPPGANWEAAAISPRPDGQGYWILANSGAVYGFPASTPYLGGANGQIPAADLPAVSFQAKPDGSAYWILSRAGGIYSFPPTAGYGGANTPTELNGKPAVGFTPAPTGAGYWIMQEWVNPNAAAVFTHGAVDYWGGANVVISGATPAQPSTPINGSRFFSRTPNSVPTLQVAGGTGANGRQYRFFLATDPAAASEVIQMSDWQSSTSWTPSPSVLKDGRTYFWRVVSKDFGLNNPPTLNSNVANFRVDRRFGSGGVSPVETVGPLTVNLASGNGTTSWATPTVNGGGVSLTYNSLAPIETTEPGLPTGWSASWAGDTSAQTLIAAGGTVTVVMVDGSKETFTWANGVTSGDSWQPVDGSDSTLTSNGGSKWIYTTADGTVHEFDVYGTLTATHKPVDERRSSALVYTWANSPVGRRMTAATDPVSGRVMRNYFQGDGQNGCPSSPPAGSVAAPPGYLCRVRLMDDRTFDVGYTVLASGIVQIGRVAGSDGSSTAWSWEVANSAALGGQYSRLVGVTDALASDAIAAGLRTDDATARTEVSYQADGRVASVTRPAPTAGAVRQVVRITYSANGATVNRDGDQKPNGYSRQVEFDTLGRQTLERDQGGRTTSTAWRGALAGDTAQGDFVSYVDDPSGMRTSTVYDDQLKPIEQWGPAPVGWFAAPSAASGWASKPTAGNQAATPKTTTAYDEGLQGLAVSAFATPDLTGGVKRREFRNGYLDIGAGSYQGLPADNWSMRAEALLVPPVSGSYLFKMDTDGGARLYLDDVKVWDGWDLPDGSLQTAPWKSATLTAGKRVKVRIEYRDRGGNAYWSLWWTPPGQAASWVPVTNLQPNYALTTSTVDADGRVSRTSYTDAVAGLDPSDGLATSTTQVVGGGQADLVSTMSYEPDSATVGWRRPTQRTLPAGAGSAVAYAYYADSGDPVANSCGVGAGTNQAGRPKSTTAADPDGAGPQRAIKRWYVYDTSGRTRGLLTTTADVSESALGSQPWVCTTFDTRGRPTSVNYPAFGGAAARTVTTDYSNPLEVKVTDPAGTITTTVDLLGRTTKYRDVWGTQTTSTYDVANRPVSSSMAGQTTANTYQPDGLLDKVSINGKVVADTTYLADGRLSGVSYPSGATGFGNGTTGEFTYDTLARPAGITWKAPGGALLASENVTRFNSGNLRERWHDGNNLNGSNPDFVYDGAGRLTTAVMGLTVYGYNFADSASCGTTGAGKNSNRTSKTIAGVATTYCYDAADRLTSSSEPTVGTIGYDSRGNTTSIFGETHTYDIADRHLSTAKGGTTVAYVRDATDRIVERKVNGTAVARYLSSGGGDSPDATLDVATGNTEFTWVLPGGALFTYKPAAVASSVWTYPNLQGSALAVADHSGVKQGVTMVWDPDGNNIAGGVPDNMVGNFDYGWLGQHQRPLETQAGLSPMIEMGARQYSPLLGRFLEVDPVEGGTANDYVYVDDPVNSVDLDGAKKKKKKWKYTRCGDNDSYKCAYKLQAEMVSMMGGRKHLKQSCGYFKCDLVFSRLLTAKMNEYFSNTWVIAGEFALGSLIGAIPGVGPILAIEFGAYSIVSQRAIGEAAGAANPKCFRFISFHTGGGPIPATTGGGDMSIDEVAFHITSVTPRPCRLRFGRLDRALRVQMGLALFGGDLP